MRLAPFALLLAACGDSSKSIVDAGLTDDGSTDAAALDALIDAAPDAMVGCGVLDPTEVVVDKTSTAASIGTASC